MQQKNAVLAITFMADLVMNECRKLEKSRVAGRREVQCSSYYCTRSLNPFLTRAHWKLFSLKFSFPQPSLKSIFLLR